MEHAPTKKLQTRKSETRVYGLHSCLALAARRFDDILRIYLTEERLKDLSQVLKRCAEARKPYRVVTADELEKITESRHHEGVCIAAKPKPLESIEELIALSRRQRRMCLVVLDEVGNPHNVGAILRVAAHFGTDGVLIRGDEGTEKSLSSAIYRTSEGGAEYCRIAICADLAQDLRRLREAGFRLVATSSHASKSVFETQLPERCALLLGSEGAGLSKELRQQSELEVVIPGTGRVESLNVSCATAVLLGEHWRQHGPQGQARPAQRPRKPSATSKTK
ncbi:MAG: rRNA methyltransferase [Myxococcota bacterium]|nr:rRNA methyltransferase [Myxococcota bacterium]